MNTETIARKERLAAHAAHSQRVQALARDYIDRSGIGPADFARRIGYAYSTLNLFLNDKYCHVGGDDSQICAAVLNFVERYPVGADSAFQGQLYEIGNVRAMREIFARLFDRPQAYMVYAPPGSGKTDVANYLIAEHNRERASHNDRRFIFPIYCRQSIRPRDLMRRIAHACGTSATGEIDRIIANLRWEFRDARVTLYCDEAQHLSIECFETVRELLDQQPRFSLLFAGSHELERIFSRFAGTLEQLERRITDKITLPAVTREEAAGIVRSELQEVAPNLDKALVHQQIEIATVQVRVKRDTQRYISIGRLMAAIRETREALLASEGEQQKGEVQ